MTPAQPRIGDRSLFSTLDARAYLHHAGISPLSDPVVEAVRASAADQALRGARAFVDGSTQRDALRETLAGLVGGRAADVGFVPNTAGGLNAIAWSFPFEAGDRIALFDGEYPSNVLPFLRVAERFGLRVDMLSLQPFAAPDGPDFAALERVLSRRPRLLSVSAVQFQTGLRMPLAEIATRCRHHGVRLCVDAVQAAGALPLDVEALGVDYLACGSHKWLMGPDGGGFVSIRPDAMAALRPAFVGAMSYTGTADMLFGGGGHLHYDHPLLTEARVFETGMVSTLTFAGLGVSAAILATLTPAAVLDHTLAYGDRLEAGLLDRGFVSLRAPDRARRSATLAVLPPDGYQAHLIAPALGARGVVCGSPDGRLRFSPHFENHPDEIDHVLAALDEILIEQRS